MNRPWVAVHRVLLFIQFLFALDACFYCSHWQGDSIDTISCQFILLLSWDFLLLLNQMTSKNQWRVHYIVYSPQTHLFSTSMFMDIFETIFFDSVLGSQVTILDFHLRVTMSRCYVQEDNLLHVDHHLSQLTWGSFNENLTIEM
jgi:hypothetical protein